MDGRLAGGNRGPPRGMSLPVEFAPAALNDRERLAAFLSAESPAAADRAVDILAAAFERLGAFPLSGMPGPKGGRVR